LISHPETISELSATGDELAWRNSTHVIDFIRVVVRDCATRTIDFEANRTLCSLQMLLQRLESPPAPVEVGFSLATESNFDVNTTMPPQDSVVAVLRWTKGASKHMYLPSSFIDLGLRACF
jgi:hypothetical protein